LGRFVGRVLVAGDWSLSSTKMAEAVRFKSNKVVGGDNNLSRPVVADDSLSLTTSTSSLAIVKMLLSNEAAGKPRMYFKVRARQSTSYCPVFGFSLEKQ
jgi:hypothetical protein